MGKERDFWEKERETRKGERREKGHGCGFSHVVSGCDLFTLLSHQSEARKAAAKGGVRGQQVCGWAKGSAINNISTKPLLSTLTKR